VLCGQVTAHFSITGITSAYKDPNPSDPDIWLVGVRTPTQITSDSNASSATAANGDGIGVRLDGSSGIALDGLSYNKMTGPGGFLLDGPGTYQVTVQNSHATGIGPICVTADHQKVNTGYYSDLQNSLSLADGAHGNVFIGDTFHIPAATGYSIAGGGNGFFLDACADYAREPFAPAEAQAGAGNVFTGVCYNQPASLPGLPPSAASCPGS
jgi:hypothetical protein